MTTPWATFLVDRDRLWQTWQQLKWHASVPMKHMEAPLVHAHTLRVSLLVATHDPVASVLVSASIATLIHNLCVDCFDEGDHIRNVLVQRMIMQTLQTHYIHLTTVLFF